MRKRLYAAIFLLAAATAHAAPVPQWAEVRSDHFIVITDTNEKQARHIAGQFEQMRALFLQLLPRVGNDASTPIVVLALKDRKGFQSLEPASYLTKNSIDLAGLFIRTPDRNYIVLRLDSQDEHPYATIYHEYTHFVMRKAEWMPLWLNEGLAEFYQNTDIEPHEVILGRPSLYDMHYLRQTRLLPLTTLFTVDQRSPLYQEEEKGSVFYAESGALTRLIKMGDLDQHTDRLQTYADNLTEHEDPILSARNAFGDLGQLQKTLETYIRHNDAGFFRLDATFAVDESAFRARSIPIAEVNAFRADILIWTGRHAEAKTLLDATLRDDPNSALAHESMGALCFAKSDSACAKKWFTEAAALDSQSYLANYYFAVLSMNDPDTSRDAAIEASLRTSIKLEPAFAPSYDALARFYSIHNANFDEAYQLDQQAIQLEPEELSYRVSTAQLLVQQKQFDQAIAVLDQARAVAKSPADVAMVQERIERLNLLQHALSISALLNAETNVSAEANRDGTVKITAQQDRINESAPHPPISQVQRHFIDAAPASPTHTVTGTLHRVFCSTPSVMTLEIEDAGKAVSLFANNYHLIPLVRPSQTSNDTLSACAELEDRQANVVYAEAPGKDVTGQILFIELTQ